MTYRYPPTCRRGGCAEPASTAPARDEGDIGWCDSHRLQVREMRARLTSGVKMRPDTGRHSWPKDRAL